MEKNLDPADVVTLGKVCVQQKVEKEAEKEDLGQDPEVLNEPVLFRFFFFQCSVSPNRRLPALSVGRFPENAALRG